MPDEIIPIDCKDAGGCTPLIFAARKGSVSMVKLLLENGADVSLKNDAGFTALHASAMKGNPENVQIILDAGADVNAQEPVNGVTSLYVAAQEGHVQVTFLLLDAGADVDVATACGATSLYTASCNGYHEVVRLLSRANADPLVACQDFTPLEVASYKNYPNVVAQLVEHYGLERCGGPTLGTNALMLAAQEQSIDCLEVLAKYGAVDVCAQALRTAVTYGKEKSVIFLLRSCRSDDLETYVNCKDSEDKSALYCLFSESALNSSTNRIFRWLIDSGADFFNCIGYVPPENSNKFNLKYMARGGFKQSDERDEWIEAFRKEILRFPAATRVSWGWPAEISSTKEKKTPPFKCLRWKKSKVGVVLSVLNEKVDF